MARTPAPAPLLAASVLSGAAALVYQVLWARELSLALGSTTGAIATVLAAFMAGLGLGSALAARALTRRAPSGWAYTGLEAGIAAAALALPPLLRASGTWLAPLYESGSPATLAMVRALLAGGLLVAPTALMGATLPVLGALSRADGSGAGRVAGALYAANTVGAVAGSLAAPLLLLPAIGMARSNLVAVGLNVLAGALAVVPARGEAGAGGPTATPRRLHPAAPASPPLEAQRTLPAVLAVAALSGLGALAHEVAWTRTLTLLIGPTAYSFAFILAAVIGGIALGSAAAAPLADRVARPLAVLGALQAATAAASLAVTHLVGALPVPVGELVRGNAERVGRLLALELAGVFAVLLLPCLLFGATFPFAVAAVARHGRATGRAVGEVYAWNTAGAVAGSLLAGFVALPLLGLRGTLLAAAATHALAGLVAGTWSRAPAAAAAAAVLGLAGPTLLPSWDAELMAGGVYRYAVALDAGALEEELRAGDLLFHREGRAATVTVKRLGRTLSLAIDGKVEASSTGDMLTQRMLAHLPLVLHPSPRTACIVGLGSGATAAAALVHPLDRLDVVELSPEIVAASALFRPHNRDALADPRLHLVLGDGRHHLRIAGRRYDVISSEPSNPWMPGASALFTREAFAAARGRLAPGGVFAQWVQLYGLDPADLRRVVAGFTDVFPRAALFLLSEGDAVLVGHDEAWAVPSPEELRGRLRAAAVRDDLASVRVSSAFVFATLHVLEGDALRRWAGDPARHTDDRPLLELGAARSLLAETGAMNHAALLEAAAAAPRPEPWLTLATTSDPADLVERALMLEEAGAPGWSFATFVEAFRRAPAMPSAGDGLVRTALRIEAAEAAEAELRSAASSDGEAEVRTALATLLAATGRPAEAAAELQRALVLDPRHVGALSQAAAMHARLGRAEDAFLLAARAAALAPDDPEPGTLMAAALLAGGRREDASEQAERVLRRHAGHPPALAVAAQARASLGDVEAARAHLDRFVEVDPEDWAAFNLLGRLALTTGRNRDAARAFERAVELSFDNREGWEGLRAAAAALDDPALERRAERALARLRTAG